MNALLKAGADAGADPWGADTLEWGTASPPPQYNFEPMPAVNGRALRGRSSTFATSLIKGPPGTPVTLTVARGSRTLRLRLERASITRAFIIAG